LPDIGVVIAREMAKRANEAMAKMGQQAQHVG